MKTDSHSGNRRRDRARATGPALMRTPVFIGIVIALLVIAGIVNTRFRKARRQENIRESAGVEAPTELVSALLLGGFRGVAINLLWLHAQNLQDQKKYYEIPALCELILTLQPNIPDVWMFQAWNLAYNITVKWQAAEDRWRWVRRGIAVAEKGTEHNPDSFFMKHITGWIYLHKCGDSSSDPYSPYYRRRIREETGRSSYLIAGEWFEKALDVYLRNPDPLVKPYTAYLLPHQAYLQYIVQEAVESPAASGLSFQLTRIKDSYLKEAIGPLEKAMSTLTDFVREAGTVRSEERQLSGIYRRLQALHADAKRRLEAAAVTGTNPDPSAQ